MKTIVILAFEANLMRMVQEVLEMDGYTVLATRDANDALRILEQSVEPCILLLDNFHVAPPARDALPRLAANPALRKRVRIIGLSNGGNDAIELGQVDTLLPLPFEVSEFFDAIER